MLCHPRGGLFLEATPCTPCDPIASPGVLSIQGGRLWQGTIDGMYHTFINHHKSMWLFLELETPNSCDEVNMIRLHSMDFKHS